MYSTVHCQFSVPISSKPEITTLFIQKILNYIFATYVEADQEMLCSIVLNQNAHENGVSI